MNRESTKELIKEYEARIEVMKYFVDGGDVEFKSNIKNAEFELVLSPAWNWNDGKYIIQPSRAMIQAELKNKRWWVGSNSWNSDAYSKEEAEKMANTLVNCDNCYNCSYCSSCSYCRYCSYCSDCSDCRYCSSCIDCRYCRYCSSCRYCRYCSDCSDCRSFESNPQRITSPILGSRKSKTTCYWDDKKEQIVCGCFAGTMEEFKAKVRKEHGDNDYARGYFKWIESVELYKNSLS